jgi:hypothetical protein
MCILIICKKTTFLQCTIRLKAKLLDLFSSNNATSNNATKAAAVLATPPPPKAVGLDHPSKSWGMGMHPPDGDG